VVWLLVVASSESKASPINSWRRQGWGHLMLIMVIKRSKIELLQHLEQPVCWEPLTEVDFTSSTPRLMPRLYINPVDLFKSMIVQLLILFCFQNWFLELYFQRKMVVELPVLGFNQSGECYTLVPITIVALVLWQQ
jgi:hypothetical protein